MSTTPAISEPILLPFEDKNLREPYREYFTTKRKNYQAVVRDVPELWDCFLRLDEIWARDLDQMQIVTEKERPLLIAMFGRSHAQFRIAFELGFSTAIGEAWNVMRSAIDTAVVAHKIYREPNLMPVWLRKDDGKAERRAYKQAFEENKKESLFPAKHGLAELHKFYRDYSEWGTRASFGAAAMRLTIQPIPNGQHWNRTYLEIDPKRVAAFLYQMLEASGLVEAACFNCFENRLRLDSDLVDMRRNFAKCQAETATVINQILNA